LANQKTMLKEKGNVETCHCGTQVKCIEKPAAGNYPAKLQWQNFDGKAHFFYDHTKSKGEEGEFTCTKSTDKFINEDGTQNTLEQTTPSPPPAQTVSTAPKTPEETKSNDALAAKIADEIGLIHKIDSMVLGFLKAQAPNQREDLVNLQKVGLWTKLIYPTLREQN